MATFAQSPAPRRRHGASGSSPRNSPGGVAVTELRKGGSRMPPSRLGTPGRGPGASVDEGASEMDVDEPGRITVEKHAKPPVVFAKSENLSAFLYAALPVEVKHNFRNTDFYREPWSGSVDEVTGFALVASPRTCFVWQHTQALLGTPTCYIFACPQTASRSPPLHALVPSGTTREPGLILLSESGEVRFWDSVSSGLAGGQHFSTTSLPLEAEEIVTVIQRSDAQTFVISTSYGQLFRLTLMSSGGRTTPSAHPFVRARPSAGLSRFLPGVLWGGSGGGGIGEEDPESISAVALGEVDETGRDVWALTETRLQRWRLLAEGSEQRISEERIDRIIGRAVKVAFAGSAPKDDYEFDLELVDLAASGSEELLTLVSFAGNEDKDVLVRGDHPRRIYVIVRISYATDSPEVAGISAVPYQSTASNTAPVHPRLRLIPGSTVAAVQFGDAVTFCSTESQYRDRLELKISQDRILGTGVTGAQGELLLFTSGTMLRAVLDTEKITRFNSETGHVGLIKSTMTQSILYGPIFLNPLRFSLPPDVDEEALMRGATSLSQSVVESDPALVSHSLDLSNQLKGRMELLKHLITFINENGACHKMTSAVRQGLLFDAEKIYAASRLWSTFEEYTRGKDESDTVLVAAIHEYMNKVADADHEDELRAFFRLYLNHFDELFRYVAKIISRASSQAPDRVPELLAEANRIAITVLTSALEWRQDNAEKYQVHHPLGKAWTSRARVLELLNDLINATHALLMKSDVVNNNKDEHVSQLAELAALIFSSYHERLEYLSSPFAAENEGVRTDLEAELKVLQPSILEKLCDHSLDEEAFVLAERYQDFQSLAGLCTKDIVFPPEKNPHAARIEQYTEQYKDAFTTALYDQYLGRGEARGLFALDQNVHQPYLDRYYSQRQDSETAWLHELGMRRYDRVAKLLLGIANDADELSEKHLILSLGKLAQIANVNNASVDYEVDVFNAQLDSVAIHERLAEEFKAVKTEGRGQSSMDALIETIQRTKASNLSGKPAFETVFRQAVRGILSGKALNVEDMVDLLTMKDNADEAGRDDYVLALNLLHRTRDLPSGRAQSAVSTIWRRIYIHDDWSAISNTAGLPDAAIMDNFRSTALYSVVRSFDDNLRQDIFRSWTEVGTVPTLELLASRWEEVDQRTLEALQADYQAESEALERYAQSAVFDRVMHLADEDARQNI